MKNISFILSVALICLSSFADAKNDNVRYYKHNYLGLIPGESKLRDVKKVLGRTLDREKTSNGKNYHFEKVIVNFSKPDKSVINTIIIIRDSAYKSPNGIVLGTSMAEVKRILKSKSSSSKTITDFENGISYWFRGGKVSRIVLSHSLIVN